MTETPGQQAANKLIERARAAAARRAAAKSESVPPNADFVMVGGTPDEVQHGIFTVFVVKGRQIFAQVMQRRTSPTDPTAVPSNARALLIPGLFVAGASLTAVIVNRLVMRQRGKSL